MALKSGNSEKLLAQRAERDPFVETGVSDRRLRGLDDVAYSGKED
jgi:hypothetical protein